MYFHYKYVNAAIKKIKQWKRGLFSLPLKAVLTIESYDVIAIAALGDWLHLLASAIQPMRSKTKTNRILLYALFFPRK